MNRERKLPFDPKAFLSKVNAGRAISDYRKDQNVYTQGERADSVFYIQSGKVRKTVVSEQGKEAVVALLGTGDFFGAAMRRASDDGSLRSCLSFNGGERSRRRPGARGTVRLNRR
jgi:signal-transduction protein with cAMP-binding, CBS, and nucleotidyltransferase domain